MHWNNIDKNMTQSEILADKINRI